jgi:glycerol-3-phosphate dehydrogenase (NAD(P)+)
VAQNLKPGTDYGYAGKREQAVVTEKSVLVIGAGSWGTALAIVLARNGHIVSLWDNEIAHIERLQEENCNHRYLPGITFPAGLKPISNLIAGLYQVKDIVIAVPCADLPDVLDVLVEETSSQLKICLACKGLASGKQLLNHQLVEERLQNNASVAVLSGPSFASEVACGLPTAVTVASDNRNTAEYFAILFHTGVFRAYIHDDIIGVQIGGAVKNIMAIAAGIADGLGFGANTRAALITRGLIEIMRLGVVLGGRQETFMGLAGLGDLVLTCTDDQSRNRRLGLLLAKGKTVEEARAVIGRTIEGVRTVGVVMKLAEKYAVEMPISEQVAKVLQSETSPREAVQALLAREPKAELI